MRFRVCVYVCVVSKSATTQSFFFIYPVVTEVCLSLPPGSCECYTYATLLCCYAADAAAAAVSGAAAVRVCAAPTGSLMGNAIHTFQSHFILLPAMCNVRRLPDSQRQPQYSREFAEQFTHTHTHTLTHSQAGKEKCPSHPKRINSVLRARSRT